MKMNNLWILAILVLPLAVYAFLGTRGNITSDISMANGVKSKMVMITSTMCGECVKMKKVLSKTEPSYSNDIIFEKLDASTPAAKPYVEKYNIQLVPTMLFFKKDGKLYQKIEGSIPQNELEKYLKELKNG
jgi:thioredoxin-related protein